MHNTKHLIALTAFGLFSIMPILSFATTFSGRLSIVGSAMEEKTATADQQSFRAMLENSNDLSEWSIHVKTRRQNFRNLDYPLTHSSEVFRFHKLSEDWIDNEREDGKTQVGYAVDQIYYRHRFDAAVLGVGRQPVDFGSGRFWQPLNIFGSFSAIDLDTDYKPGIDAAILDWYPSPFSSLKIAYVLAPENKQEIKDSSALYYRSQIGDSSEISLLAANVVDNTIIGGSFETDWNGFGLRLEGAYYELQQNAYNSQQQGLFWIAGADYQFSNGLFLSFELYDNALGASKQENLAQQLQQELIAKGIVLQLSRHLVAMGMGNELTPLLRWDYSFLLSRLENNKGSHNTSNLHQLSLSYSIAENSDCIFSILSANGRDLSQSNLPRSEFGHIPASISFRLRHYF